MSTKLNVNDMSNFELARWYALMDAIQIISDKASDRNIKFDKVDIKPSAVEKYIEATCDIYCRKLDAIENSLEQPVHKNTSTLLPSIINAINNVDYESPV